MLASVVVQRKIFLLRFHFCAAQRTSSAQHQWRFLAQTHNRCKAQYGADGYRAAHHRFSGLQFASVPCVDKEQFARLWPISFNGCPTIEASGRASTRGRARYGTVRGAHPQAARACIHRIRFMNLHMFERHSLSAIATKVRSCFMGGWCVQYAPDSINTVTPMSR